MIIIIRIKLHNLGILGIFLFTFGGATIFTVMSELFAFGYVLPVMQRDLYFLMGILFFGVGLFMMNEFRKPDPENNFRTMLELIFGFGSLIFGGLFFLDSIDVAFFNFYHADVRNAFPNSISVLNFSLLAFFFTGLGSWLIIKGKKYL